MALTQLLTLTPLVAHSTDVSPLTTRLHASHKNHSHMTLQKWGINFMGPISPTAKHTKAIHYSSHGLLHEMGRG